MGVRKKKRTWTGMGRERRSVWVLKSDKRFGQATTRSVSVIVEWTFFVIGKRGIDGFQVILRQRLAIADE